MTLAFTAEALSLGDLLSGDRRFAIPVFQRAYSWTSREVGQLVGDLWLALAEQRHLAAPNGGLLLGSVVVVDERRRTGAAGDGLAPAWVIDGKQRLTTLTILLAILRDQLGDAAGWIGDLIWRIDQAQTAAAPSPRLVLDLEEDTYFGVQVRRPGASIDPSEPQGDHKGRRGIRDAQETIAEDLEDRSIDDLLALAEFLRDQVALVLITAPDIDTGFKLFVTTNHRGKPLSPSDILKAELMAEVPEQHREARLAQWGNAERALGKDFHDLPGYLRALHSRSQGPIIRDVLDVSHREGGAVQFLDATLFPLADRLHPILHAAHAGSPFSARINTSLRYLNWLRARDWVPPALAFSSRYPGRNEDFAVFLEALERLAYGLQILGSGADRRQARYRSVIDAMGNAAVTESAQAPLNLTDDEQWTMVLNARSNLYHRSQSTCKLLLKRLSASYPGDDPMPVLADVTVEHILPRNLSAESPWRRAIPDAEEREACSKMLGNLVLLSKQQNKDARNNAFEIKQGIVFPAGRPSPHAITNQIKGLPQWGADEIRARDAYLLQRMTDIWQLKGQPRAKWRRQAALVASS